MDANGCGESFWDGLGVEFKAKYVFDRGNPFLTSKSRFDGLGRQVTRPWFGPTLVRDFLGRGSPSCETRVSANQGLFTTPDLDAIFGAPQVSKP